MSSEPDSVKLWRDTFKLNLRIGFREDIIATVTDLKLWKEVLENWGYWKDGKWIKFSPLNVKGMLSEYELRTTSAARRANAAVGPSGQREGYAKHGQAGIPERSNSQVLEVPRRMESNFRTGRRTLAEIVSQALRSQT